MKLSENDDLYIHLLYKNYKVLEKGTKVSVIYLICLNY